MAGTNPRAAVKSNYIIEAEALYVSTAPVNCLLWLRTLRKEAAAKTIEGAWSREGAEAGVKQRRTRRQPSKTEGPVVRERPDKLTRPFDSGADEGRLEFPEETAINTNT